MDLRLQNLKENFMPMGIRALFTDVDGTLTDKGRFSGALISTLERLQAHNIKVILTTGRSAGWVHALASYLPVAGAMAENGGVYVSASPDSPLLLLNAKIISKSGSVPYRESLAEPRAELAAAFLVLKKEHPQLHTTADNDFRLTDYTFDLSGLSLTARPAVISSAQRICEAHGLAFEYSSIHGHIMHLGQNKGLGVLSAIANIPELEMSVENLVTLGDSPNDQSLFERSLFPYSVGVANVRKYAPQMQHVPRFITDANESYGFMELATLLLSGSI